MTTTDELQLRPFLSGIADAIREVEESEEDINAQEFVERIKALGGGGMEQFLAIDDYMPTSEVNMSSTTISIPHSLGAVPTRYILWIEDALLLAGANNYLVMQDSNEQTCVIRGSGVRPGYYNVGVGMDENEIRLGKYNLSMSLKKDANYKIITMR